MAAILAVAATDNWNSNGSWVGGVQPTAADDVTIVAGATVTIPAGITALCRSCTIAATGAVVFAATTSILTIGDGTAGAGNVAFSNAGTITLTAIGTINFVSTSATVQTITTGGQTLPNLTFNGVGGSWQAADPITIGATSILTLTSGTFDNNGKASSWGLLVCNSSNTRVLTLTGSSLTMTGAGTWDIGNSVGLTLNAGSSTITFSGANTVFAGGGKTYNNIVVNSTSNGFTLGASGATMANLTISGSANKVNVFTMSAVGTLYTITGTLTVTGNSVLNRIFMSTSVVGTQRTVTAAAIALTNVDIMDIQGAGLAGNAAWTGTSLGNALGNTNITFDTPATQTHTASAGGNWSDVTKWTSRVPLPQDNVIVDVNTTGTLTADMPRMGAAVDFTGFAGTYSNSVGNTVFGSLTFSITMTLSGGGNMTFGGRSNHTITSAGKSYLAGQSLTVAAPGGTYTLQDALSGQSAFNVTNGTFISSNFNITASFYSFSTGTTETLGTSTLTGTTTTAAATIFSFSSTCTLSAASATFVVSTATPNTRTFGGGGKTFGTLTYTVASSPGSLIISGANTFTTINGGSGRIITVPSATTTTVTNFNVNGAVNGYLYLPGVLSNYASAPDSAAVSITGDIDMRIRLTLDVWQLATLRGIFTKFVDGAGKFSYMIATDSVVAGRLRFYCSTDGTTNSSITSTAAVSFANGDLGWIRVTRIAATGVHQFFTSSTNTNDPNAVSWTQLGTDVTGTAGNIFDNTALIEFNSWSSGGAALNAGKYYRGAIYSTIGGSTPVFDADFTSKTVGANSFTESSSNAATVTINGVLAQVGDGRVSLVSSTGASAATMTSTNQQSVNYLSIQDSTVNASPKWYAGANSTNVSGNTNWLFVNPLSGGTMLMMGV